MTCACSHLFRCWPPSVNHTWTVYRSQICLKPQVKIFRENVAAEMCVARAKGLMPRRPMTGDLAVELLFAAPDRKRRDIDNLLKSTLDALTASGLWEDDSQIKDLHVSISLSPLKQGSFVLTVEAL